MPSAQIAFKTALWMHKMSIFSSLLSGIKGEWGGGWGLPRENLQGLKSLLSCSFEPGFRVARVFCSTLMCACVLSNEDRNWVRVFFDCHLRRQTMMRAWGWVTPIYNWRGCSSKFSKETPKSYHIGCVSSQFYSLKVTSKIFIHNNNTGILKIIAKGLQVLL